MSTVCITVPREPPMFWEIFACTSITRAVSVATDKLRVLSRTQLCSHLRAIRVQWRIRKVAVGPQERRHATTRSRGCGPRLS